jgi:predicted SprT family Zn-dependent metalloprotease
MKDVEDLKLAWQSVLSESLARLAQHTSDDFAERIIVVWNRRMRSTAGRAYWPEAKVELNPRLLGINMLEVQRTLLHELAHLLAYHRSGRRKIAPHGVEWRNACVDLGIPNEGVTHSLPLPSRKQKIKWRYSCRHCDNTLNRVRKIKRAVACYSCCLKYSGGKYDKKYLLVGEQLE